MASEDMSAQQTSDSVAEEATTQAAGAKESAVEKTQEETQAIQSSMDKAAEGTEKTFDALSPSAAESGQTSAMTQKKLDVLHKLSVNTVYLMGSSFIVGVLFTVFVLLVLDFMRRNADNTERSE